MNENLILEGNTIYELDPVCMRTKRNFVQKAAKGEKITAIAGKEKCCGCNAPFSCYTVFCAFLLAGYWMR